MEDGRRERIMVACLTFETVKILEPIKFYQCTKVYLIHYVSETSHEKDIYTKFYEYAENSIKDFNSDIEIIECIAKVNDFTLMMKSVHSILEKERTKSINSDIFVNISAGSSEYIAAASMASMMFVGIIPFSVPSEKYTIDAKEYFDKESGKPIGITKEVMNPKVVPKFVIESPDRNLVLGLKILEKCSKNKMPKGTEIISELKKKNLWYRYKTTDKDSSHSDAVYYYRDYVSKWVKNGWVYQDKYNKKYALTETGKLILSMFFTEDEVVIG